MPATDERPTHERRDRALRKMGVLRVDSEGRKHSENCTFLKDPLNFDAPHRANARTHAQAETANGLLSLCSIGGVPKKIKKKLKLKKSLRRRSGII